MTEPTNEPTNDSELAYIADIVTHTAKYAFRQGFEAAILAREAINITDVPEAGKMMYDKILNNTLNQIITSIINGLGDNSEPKDSEGQAEQVQEAGSDAATDDPGPVN